MNKTIMITGANSGLGKEAARQLALINNTEKIYLACRNMEKAKAAKAELIEETGRDIFEIIIMDVSDPGSVKNALKNLEEPVDALIMNAGGMGGKKPAEITGDGVTLLFASNMLGHVVLLESLLKDGKLNNVAMYAGSEGARGVPAMSMPRPELNGSSEDDFASIFDGTRFEEGFDQMIAYGYVKYGAAMWMASLARKYPKIRFVTMSPGFTKGTEAMGNLPPMKKFMFKYIMLPIVAPLRGMVHKLEVGAKRYVDAINDTSYESGVFYASKENTLTGPVVDQSTIFSDLKNERFQDNAYKAVHRFVSI